MMMMFTVVKRPLWWLTIKDAQILCEVNGDINAIPAGAVSKKVSNLGPYYEVEFQVGLHFLTTLEFKIMAEGKVIGTAVANYL